jgi:ubiquinone/menaquinone biosynthesis C-methylase UbiE
MNPNKALWEKGDFTRIAETMRKSGEEFVNKIGITSGMEVLDLGGGDGTTAIPAAKLGANVTVIDIASNLVQAGNARAAKEQLNNCKFQEGDASDLNGVADATFDAVVSIFGAMFAPRPFDVAKEMVRVTKPGGKIIMGNWIPGDPTLVAQILKISSSYTPPPPEGFISPVSWGVEANVTERFAAAGIPKDKITFSREPWTFTASYPPEEYVAIFKNYYGPTMNAFDAAEKNGKSADLQKELEQLFAAHNKSGSPDTTYITATYLLVTVQR